MLQQRHGLWLQFRSMALCRERERVAVAVSVVKRHAVGGGVASGVDGGAAAAFVGAVTHSAAVCSRPHPSRRRRRGCDRRTGGRHAQSK